MHAEEERTVKLKTAIPVYLGYWTARVSGDGVMQFRKDVYGIDGRLSGAAGGPVEPAAQERGGGGDAR